MDDNKIIRSFWMGAPLTNLEKLSISSFIKNGHQFELFVYDKSIICPNGGIIRDANEIIPKSKLFLDSRGTYASFSDWFRFKMLFELGGWWSDLDSVCLRHLDINKEFCFSSEGNESSFDVNCGNIKALKDSDFLDECLFRIDRLLKKQDYTWGKFGIELMRNVLPNYEYTHYLLSPKYFCPIPYLNVDDFIQPLKPIIPKETFAVHLWNEMWRLKNLDKNCDYPISSLFEQLKQRYLFE